MDAVFGIDELLSILAHAHGLLLLLRSSFAFCPTCCWLGCLVNFTEALQEALHKFKRSESLLNFLEGKGTSLNSFAEHNARLKNFDIDHGFLIVQKLKEEEKGDCQ